MKNVTLRVVFANDEGEVRTVVPEDYVLENKDGAAHLACLLESMMVSANCAEEECHHWELPCELKHVLKEAFNRDSESKTTLFGIKLKWVSEVC